MNRTIATVVSTVLESVLGVVDWALARIPNPVPSSGRLRQLRGQGVPPMIRPVINPVVIPVRRARRPLLAAIGTADLLADRTRQLGLGIDLSFESWSVTSERWTKVTASRDRAVEVVPAGTA